MRGFNGEFVRRLTSSEKIKQELPLSTKGQAAISKIREEISDVILDKSDKFLMIIGPCSADSEEPVLDYCARIADLQQKYPKMIFVPRIYTIKPRTNGDGYKGISHHPRPGKQPDIDEGIRKARDLHIKVIEKTGLASADELLYPDSLMYFDDLLGYVAIGARSSEDQIHRLVSSAIGIPLGLKNPTSGDLSVFANSVYAAQRPHTFPYMGWEVRSKGNPLAHGILRGAQIEGEHIPNYERIGEIIEKCRFENPMVVVDLNHSNSKKNPFEQPNIAKRLLDLGEQDERIRFALRGFMIESYLVSGSQKINGCNVYGKSLTDACLGWRQTEKMIGEIHQRLDYL